MKPISKLPRAGRTLQNAKTNRAVKSLCCGVLGLGLALSLSHCNRADDPVAPAAPEAKVTHEALAPTRAADNPALEKSAGTATYLHFGDKTACTWNPDICKYSMVFWPGYIQSTGAGEWGYVWMSNGPWTEPIGTQPFSELSKHYHILGLADPASEPNPAATAMWGDWWMWVSMQRNSARVNFDLTQINVLGTVPVRIWYKDAAGYGWQWSSLGPGRWNLPGATNIQEVHISSASGAHADRFKIDEIRVTSR
jgi:hypothetical protein